MRTTFFDQVIKAVKANGYELARRGKNSHFIYQRPDRINIVIPQKIDNRRLAKELIRRATHG